ncbi:uncharacterized protein LOC111944077, partial [Cyanistes caeruleus]|uniref:uncharacterized protein LOC111944077 n=1 Tax=Cyanistes caeruleus TaxID=156563 RepID=UPI000CDA27B5
MAHSIVCTDNPGSILSTLTSTDKQDPFALLREVSGNCGRLQERIGQMDEETQTVTSRYQQMEDLIEEIRGCCENVEKSREKLQQCMGIPEPGALWLHQRNTEQQKETSPQVEKAQQQDRMEVGFGNETGFPLKTCLGPSCTVEAALEGEDPSLQSELEVKRQTLEELQLQRDLLEQRRDDVTMALDTSLLGSTCGSGSCASQISPDA